MKHVFLCGFNGFQQIQLTKDWFKSFIDKADEHEERNSQKRAVNTGETTFQTHAKERAVNVDSSGCLVKICTVNNKIDIHHAAVTWTRIGITVVTDTPSEESTAPRRQHTTVVCGYSNQQRQQASTSLQLVMDDCRLWTCNEADFLLQQKDELVLLKEDRDQTEKLRVVTVPGRDLEELERCAHWPKFGAVCGSGAEFVVSYDGISLGKLSSFHRSQWGCDESGDKDCDESGDKKNCDESGDKKDCDESGDKKQGETTLILTCLDSGLSIQRVSCGLEHCVLLTSHGTVLSFGSGSRGQLGHGALEDEQVPRVLSALEGVLCTCVAAGGWHSAAVTDCGDLFMWGWNESGQLGLPSPKLHSSHPNTSPQQHQQQLPHPPQSSHCQQPHQQCGQHRQEHQQDHAQQHQEFQQERRSLQELEQHGQFPQELNCPHQQQQQQQRQQQECHPQPESSPEELDQHQQHLFQHEPRQQQVQEMPDPPQDRPASLHLWPQVVEVVPSQVCRQGEVVVTKVACGSRHTVILTDTGEALSTGWNKYGQLGLPHTDSVDQFTRVSFGDKRTEAAKLWCGAWNTVFVVKELPEME